MTVSRRAKCVCVCVCVRERRKIKLSVWGKKVPIALDGIRTGISGIRAHRASDYTTAAGTPPVSRNKHFRHSPVSSIVKQSCTKHSNSYLRDRDVKHLQGPPLSRTRRVRERRKIELTVWGKKVPIALDGMCVCVRACVCVCGVSQWKESARRMASSTSDTSSSSKHNAKKKYSKNKRPVSSVDHCRPYRRKNKRSRLLNVHMLHSTCFGT